MQNTTDQQTNLQSTVNVNNANVGKTDGIILKIMNADRSNFTTALVTISY